MAKTFNTNYAVPMFYPKVVGGLYVAPQPIMELKELVADQCRWTEWKMWLEREPLAAWRKRMRKVKR